MDEIIQKELNEKTKTIVNNQILETDSKQENNLSEVFIDELTTDNVDEDIATIQKKSEEETPSEKIDLEDANTTNCLALTIKKDYKLVAVKNVVLHSLKVTWKVIVSAITLNILKFFF